MRKLSLISAFILLLVVTSCASPTTSPPIDSPDTILPGFSGQGFISPGHNVLGAWELVFDFENLTAEAIPVRLATGHFNVRKFMEDGPCTNCLTLHNFSPQPDETFYIDVKFTHPFPGLDNFSGFDVAKRAGIKPKENTLCMESALLYASD